MIVVKIWPLASVSRVDSILKKVQKGSSLSETVVLELRK